MYISSAAIAAVTANTATVTPSTLPARFALPMFAMAEEMEQNTITHNPNVSIPNLDFGTLPVGFDIRLVLKTGICPTIHGGMFNKEGGLIGAGMARVPMECFEKAMKAFAEEYRDK